MSQVFVDTAAWIALINVNDTLHTQAQQVKEQLRLEKATLLTTEFVFLEVADGLCMPAIRAKTTTFITRLRLLKSLRIMTFNQTWLEDDWSLYSQHSDKAWSLTDCISFVVMYRQGITHAFTSDHHFEQAGFIKLL